DDQSAAEIPDATSRPGKTPGASSGEGIAIEAFLRDSDSTARDSASDLCSAGVSPAVGRASCPPPRSRCPSQPLVCRRHMNLIRKAEPPDWFAARTLSPLARSTPRGRAARDHIGRGSTIIRARPMPSSSSRPAEPAPPGVKGQLNQFWQRVTDGLELNQLWTQFHTDARASFRLYQRDYGARRRQETQPHGVFHTTL